MELLYILCGILVGAALVIAGVAGAIVWLAGACLDMFR